VRKWIVLMGVIPLFAILAPVEIWFRGPVLALVHITFALMLSMVLLNLLLVWFRKIPFTCSYFPGKTSMAVMFFVYLAGFATYSWSMADIESRLIRAPINLALFYLIAAATIYGLTLLEQRELLIDDVLIFEDEPDPVVRSLELG